MATVALRVRLTWNRLFPFSATIVLSLEIPVGLISKDHRGKFLVTLMIGEKKALERYVLLSNKLIFS